MTKQHNDELPFRIFIKQIEDAVEYTDTGGEPYTNEQIVIKACNLLLKLGLYTLEHRDWENKTLADKT